MVIHAYSYSTLEDETVLSLGGQLGLYNEILFTITNNNSLPPNPKL